MNCDTGDWEFSMWAMDLPLYRLSEHMFSLGLAIWQFGDNFKGKPIIGLIEGLTTPIKVWLWAKRMDVREANTSVALSYCRVTQWFQGWRIRDLLADIAGHVRALIDDPRRWLRGIIVDIFDLPDAANINWDMCVYEFLDKYFPFVLSIKRDPANWVRWQLKGIATWLDGLFGDADEYIWTMLQARADWIIAFRDDAWGWIKARAKSYSLAVWALLDHPVDYLLALIASLFGLPPEFNEDPLSYLLGAFIRLLDDNKQVLERVVGYWGERFIRWLWERR